MSKFLLLAAGMMMASAFLLVGASAILYNRSCGEYGRAIPFVTTDSGECLVSKLRQLYHY